MKTKNESKPESKKLSEFSVYDGFKFGLGIFLAFLTGSVVLGLLTTAFWYMTRIL